MVSVPRRSIHLYPGELLDLIRATMMTPDEGRACISAFEDACARHLGVRHAIAVGAGRLGLRLILACSGIGKGDEVLLPAYTDQSVPGAIRRAGAAPVFVDVDRDTHNLTLDTLRGALSPRTRAVVATHLFGAPCDIVEIDRWARENDLVVIEDCAHAIDARVGDQHCGSFGHAAIFSFVVTKAVNTFGGGLVATNDDNLAFQIRKSLLELPAPSPSALMRRIATGYAVHMATNPAVFGTLGVPAMRAIHGTGSDFIDVYNRFVRPGTINANVETAFSPVQAVAGLQQIREMGRTQQARRANAERLLSAFPSSLKPQLYRATDTHAWYFLVGVCAKPDSVIQALLGHGVDVGRFPMRNVAALNDSRRGEHDYPNAQYLYEHSIQLPIHPSLSNEDVSHIVKALRSL